MKAATLDKLTEKLERIQHLYPADFAAIDVIVDSLIRRIKEESSAARGVRGRLLSRLQAIHECRQPLGGQFEQIEPLGKVRQWRCSGCRRIIMLDEKGES